MTVLQILAVGFAIVLRFMAPDAGMIILRPGVDGQSVFCIAAGSQTKISCWAQTGKTDITVADLAAMVAIPE